MHEDANVKYILPLGWYSRETLNKALSGMFCGHYRLLNRFEKERGL